MQNQQTAFTEIASEAGNAIMAFRHSKFEILEKQDKSPVTEADLKANEIITAKLTELYPKIPIVSEESENREASNKFFLFDPLDCTKEFTYGNHEFTVNIALSENGKPVMGVVYMPMNGDSFYGDQQGAKKTNRGKTTPITISGRAKDIRVMAIRSEMDKRLRSNKVEYSSRCCKRRAISFEFEIRTQEQLTNSDR